MPNNCRSTRNRKLTKKEKAQVKTIASQAIKKSYPIQSTYQQHFYSVSTTLTSQKVLSDLLAVRLPQSNLDNTLPLYSLPGDAFKKLKVLVTGVYVHAQIRGNTGTGIASADLFNNIRMRMFWTDNSYSDNIELKNPSNTHAPLDNRDVARVYFDKSYYLPTISFDPSGYAVPTQKIFKRFVRINRVIECFSISDTSSSTAWDTKKGDLYFSVWSDSSLTPHPSVDVSFQVYYKYMQ